MRLFVLMHVHQVLSRQILAAGRPVFPIECKICNLLCTNLELTYVGSVYGMVVGGKKRRVSRDLLPIRSVCTSCMYNPI
ncbi:hypothetical protein F4811DRAFT_516564 [Daldinia bambusicola]|nr:hypothetical protein F4811DRAFT_516564 [Daldinia bambusicola]